MIDILTPLGICLLLIGVIAKLLGFTAIHKNQHRYKLAILFLVAMAFVPFAGYSLFNFLYGVVGFFSLPTLALLMLFVLRQFGFKAAELNPLAKTLLATTALLIGLVLYPSAIGFMDFDLYALGYAYPISGLFAVLILMTLWFKQWSLTFIYTLAWLGWLIQLNSSPNGFDYLLDFWLVCWSLIWLSSRLIGKLKRAQLWHKN